MLSFALKIVWFSLSLSGLVACWIILGIIALNSRCFWAPLLYSIGCTIVEGIFCIGMRWQLNPFLMPPAFCIAQTILSSSGFFLATGVASAFAYEYVFKAKGSLESVSFSLPWRLLFMIPVIVYPISSSIVQIVLLLLLEAAQPTDDLQCDANHPLWVRFIGYAGSPLVFFLVFFLFSLVYNVWYQRDTKFPHVPGSNLTALPPRKRRQGRKYQNSTRPFPLVIPAPSPLPSPRHVSRRVPISPGFASPVQSARQFHLPFAPLSPTTNDGEGALPKSPPSTGTKNYTRDLSHAHPRHGSNDSQAESWLNDLVNAYSTTLGDRSRPHPSHDDDYDDSIAESVASSATPRFVSPSPAVNHLPLLPPEPHIIRSKESNDFLKYLNEYKQKKRRSGESDVEKANREGQRTQKSSLNEWDDLSSLRWTRDELEPSGSSLYVDYWASSWTNGALRKFVGGRNNTGRAMDRSGPRRNSVDSGVRVTEDSDSHYFTAEEGGSRMQISRDCYSTPENELFSRDTTAMQQSKSENEELGLNDQPEDKDSLAWRIIKVQLPITLVLLLATLSTLIDVIKQSANPSSTTTTTSFPQPSPFGTHHVALLLLVWGPVFVFGRLPVVYQKLFFFRKPRKTIHDTIAC